MVTCLYNGGLSVRVNWPLHVQHLSASGAVVAQLRGTGTTPWRCVALSELKCEFSVRRGFCTVHGFALYKCVP